MDIFEDLVAEQERLEAILSGLEDQAWQTQSGAAGWSVTDVVLHLAQTEEAVVTSVSGHDVRAAWDSQATNVDDVMDRMVCAQRAAPGMVFQRWRAARRTAVAALRQANPRQPLPWFATPLKPKTLATTRLAEHWAHGLDITGPLGVAFPDTERLRHIAWLAHSSLPYAFSSAGQAPHDVLCELTAPDGSTWRFGPPEADSTIVGSAGAFCRVGVRRLAADESGLVTTGPHGSSALRLLRTYAN